MSDWADRLAALTSVLPWSAAGYVDAGDAVSLGLTDFSAYVQPVLCGVDFWGSAPIAGAGQLYLELSDSFAFWSRGFPASDYEVAVGFNDVNWRGSLYVGADTDVDIGFVDLGGVGIDVNWCAWGIWIPYGWSPVGLPTQQ